MNINKIISLFFLFLFIGCKQIDVEKDKTITIKPEIDKREKPLKKKTDLKQKSSKFIFDRDFRNQGFAFIYNEKLYKEKQISKKIDNRSLHIFHKKIRKGSFVKIVNPVNKKTIIAQVISNDAIFSDFYNSVITQRIVDELSLNLKEPYIDLILISNETTFVAKKAKTYDEEKNVAEKVPIDGITIDNLGAKEEIKQEKTVIHNFLYSIKIADFYYKDSAENMINRIKDETNIKKPIIKKLLETKYRVLLGPFNDIKKLQLAFDEMKKLNFENLKIIKND